MLWMREHFHQDVGCLLWIAATVDEDLAFLDQVANPMPSDCYVLGVALNESKVWGKRAVNAKEREW